MCEKINKERKRRKYGEWCVLTSCNQYNFRHWGLATAKHSKYTSSPSLMLSDNVEPSRNVTIGGSANKTFDIVDFIFLLMAVKNYFHYIPLGIFLLMNHNNWLAGIICNELRDA